MMRVFLISLTWVISPLSLGDVILRDEGWKEDSSYSAEIAPYLKEAFAKKSVGPVIEFRNGESVTLEMVDGSMPMLPVDVEITVGLSEQEIDRTSLRVKAKKGLGWKTITDMIQEWLEPAECPNNRCQNLKMADNFDLTEFGPGKYTFIVDIRDVGGRRSVGKKEVNVLR